MAMSGVLRGAFGSLRALPPPPAPVFGIITPHMDQAAQILQVAITNNVGEDAANETALVAHTCILSALARAKGEIQGRVGAGQMVPQQEEVLVYLRTVDGLLEHWALRDMAIAYHSKLSSGTTGASSASGGASSTGSGVSSTSSAHPVAYPASNVGCGGGARGAASTPRGGATTADGKNLTVSIPGDPQATAEVIYRHAEEAMVIAEQAVLARDRMRSARSFHCAVVYYESLRIFGDLRVEVEARQRYAQWRCRQFSHLLENCVHDNIMEKVSVHDVYELDDKTKEGQLGSGSYGTVCVATHRTTGERFACKQLKLNRATPRYVSKLYHEVSIMRELNHPHTVKLVEVFYARRQIYLIMELASGGELFDLLTTQEGDHFSEPFSANLMQQMLSAVHYIHSKGVVHRDLKLENFLLEAMPDGSMEPPPSGPHPCVKLIDFGLSKHMAHHEIMAQQVGSAYYVAPEVLRGQYTESCDMWSMGVIMYMLVSGVPPFWGSSDAEIRQRILVGTYGFPRQQFQHVSPAAIDLIQRLLQVDPSRRLTAAQALEHPWVKSSKHHFDSHLKSAQDVLSSMQQFSSFSSMRKLMLEVVAFTLSTEKIAQVREMFEALDTDHSGTLDIDEVRTVFLDFDGIDEAEVHHIFEAAVVHNGHTINYNEFIAATMWRRIQLDEERIHQIFDKLDVDRNGFLTADTIQNAVGQDFSPDDVASMVKECDLNGDGRIDYLEFEKLWKSYQMDSQREHLGDLHLHFEKHSKHSHEHDGLERGIMDPTERVDFISRPLPAANVSANAEPPAGTAGTGAAAAAMAGSASDVVGGRGLSNDDDDNDRGGSEPFLPPPPPLCAGGAAGCGGGGPPGGGGGGAALQTKGSGAMLDDP